jgi:hypothetical protein
MDDCCGIWISVVYKLDEMVTVGIWFHDDSERENMIKTITR